MNAFTTRMNQPEDVITEDTPDSYRDAWEEYTSGS